MSGCLRIVAPSPSGYDRRAQNRRLHCALNDYLRRVVDEMPSCGGAASLLSSILLRRACSSAASLARSLERRMALLVDDGIPVREQLALHSLPRSPMTNPDSSLALQASMMPKKNDDGCDT